MVKDLSYGLLACLAICCAGFSAPTRLSARHFCTSLKITEMRSGSRASGGWPAGDPRRFAKAVEEPINGHNRLLDGALPAAGLKPVVSLAAGFASQQNLTLLRELGYSYLINLTRGSRQNYAAEFCRQRLRAAT